MDTGIVATRYAKALLRYATEQGQAEAVYGEMNHLAESLIALPRLSAALDNPVVTAADKIELLVEAAGGEAKVSDAGKRFLRLVVESGRAEAMLFIAKAYGSLYRRANHVVEGRLIVAQPLSAALTEKLRSVLEKETQCSVDFEVVCSSEIGAGFVLEYDNKRLDASLSRRIAQMRRRLSAQ